jgi:alkaline phosphatase
VDFIAAIEAVVRWIETHSHWGESLLIITSDHETGLLWGPGSDKLPFTPLVDQGPGRLPQLAFNAKGHTNSLVRVYARGAGSEGLAGSWSVMTRSGGPILTTPAWPTS